jgi:hypothetical protein
MADESLPLSQVLLDEFVQLHGTLSPKHQAAWDAAADEPARLRAVYAAIHDLDGTPNGPRSALCLSGGGIRSATFALGVMQQFAQLGVLKKFDYLSTISGGGYIGAWLSSFVRRSPDGIDGVEDQITDDSTGRNPLEPEVKPLVWLRSFSNYLTPKLGLLSGDTWAFAGSYVRNLLLVWLMFVPFLASVLAVPRLTIALLHRDVVPNKSAIVAVILLSAALAVVAFTRPVSYRTPGWLTNGRFQRYVLLPNVVAAILLVVFWAARWRTFDDWAMVFVLLMLSCLVSSLIYLIRFAHASRQQRAMHVRTDATKEGYVVKKAIQEVVAAQVAAVTAGALIYAVAKLFHEPLPLIEVPTLASWQTIPPNLTNAHGELYVCFAVPLVLAILFVQSALFVGISGWFNEEYDREWWGRAAGWVLLASVVWIAVTATTIFGPVAIYYTPRIFGSLTAVTGAVSILLGRSGKTAANAKEQGEKENSGKSSTITNAVLGLVGPLFALCILALISLGTSLIVMQIHPPDRIEEHNLARALAGSYQINTAKDLLNKEPHDAPKDLPTGWTFRASGLPAVEKDRIAAIEHLWAVDATTIPEGLVLVFGLGLFAWIVSFFIGANQFSMHGLYRNRLIRCYLGASRFRKRDNTNAFSGFDPSDNFPMHRLRPELFWGNTFTSIADDGPTIVSDVQLSSYIDWPTRAAVGKAVLHRDDETVCAAAGDLLADDLNRALDRLVLTPALPPESQSVANRLALEARFPGAFRPMTNHTRPMHVVGVTLNLVESENLAWQERKGSSFTVSPLHSGNPHVGFRPSRVYGGPNGLSLGTATAISGAAVSPNMGYNSSPALSFLLTLFNVRLGWWLGNPRKKTYRNPNPTNTLFTVLSEAFGLTNDDHSYVYLSDGGHFDNLGLYQMVLRRARCIVVSDGAADESFGFGDLGNAIRKIRIDLGIDIDITDMLLFPRSDKSPASPPKYCAVGKIRYSMMDGRVQDGTLLYIKPTVYGDEPRDVGAYAAEFDTFPHESTGDQWFSESQFESYRKLGWFAVKTLANGGTSFASIPELLDTAEQYVRDWR